MTKEKVIPDTKKGKKVKQQIQRGFDIAQKWKREQNDDDETS